MLSQFLVATTLAAAFLVPGPTFAQVTTEERLAPGQPPVIIAQRALGGGFPENSLAGIEHAIAIGVDMVKIDIQLTADGRHILMHDRTLDRTTNAADVLPDPPYVTRYRTIEDLRQLRLRGGTDGGDHPVPTLVEALDAAGDRILVAIGMKTYDLEVLARTLEERSKQNLLLFFPTPGDPAPLKEAAAATGLKVFAGRSDSADNSRILNRLAEALGPDLVMIGMVRGAYTPEFEARAAALDVRISINGLAIQDQAMRSGDPSMWQDTLEIGATAYLTAEPDSVVELLPR